MVIRTSAHFSRSSEVQIGGRSVCRHGHVEWCSFPNHLNSVPHLESVTTDSRASCSICGWVSASRCHTPRVSNFLVQQCALGLPRSQNAARLAKRTMSLIAHGRAEVERCCVPLASRISQRRHGTDNVQRLRGVSPRQEFFSSQSV